MASNNAHDEPSKNDQDEGYVSHPNSFAWGRPQRMEPISFTGAGGTQPRSRERRSPSFDPRPPDGHPQYRDDRPPSGTAASKASSLTGPPAPPAPPNYPDQYHVVARPSYGPPPPDTQGPIQRNYVPPMAPPLHDPIFDLSYDREPFFEDRYEPFLEDHHHKKKTPTDSLTLGRLNPLTEGRRKEFCLQPGRRGFRRSFLGPLRSNAEMDCQLRMDYSLYNFVKNEIDVGDSIWDVVVVTGSKSRFWATRCEDYVKQVWPDAYKTLQLVVEFATTHSRDEASIDSWGEKQKQQKQQKQQKEAKIQTETLRMNRDIKMEGERQSKEMVVTESLSWMGGGLSKLDRMAAQRNLEVTEVFGSADWPSSAGRTLKLRAKPTLLCDVLESLAWLFAVLRDGSDAILTNSGITMDDLHNDSSEVFQLALEPLAPLVMQKYGDTAATCWHPLMPHTAVASDFPVPLRDKNMRGVELSFELMCFLCGIDYEAIEEDGLILRGHRSLIYPVRVIDDCVQWHFQHFDLTSKDVLNQPITGERLSENDLQTLCEGKRHFLGLWADPVVTLGSARETFDRIRASPAQIVTREYSKDGVTVGAGIIFPKLLNLNYTQTYKMTKSRKSIYLSNFEGKMHSLINVPVVLYSVLEKRAWMVSFISVILHLARARASHQHALNYCIPACAESADGGQAAFETIMRCRNDPLKASPETGDTDVLTVKDHINEVWTGLDRAMRETYRVRRIFRTHIVGYDMTDISRVMTRLRMKQHHLTGFEMGWSPLLDEAELALFYEGLSVDPIIPGPNATRETDCPGWRTVPQGYNLLMASLPCLLQVSQHLNDGISMKRLTSQYHWHSPGRSRSVFSVCNDQSNHICNRVQELRTLDWTSPSVQHPSYPNLQAHPNGAVLFRYADDFRTIQQGLEANSVRGSRRNRTRTGSTALLEAPRHVRSDSGYSSPGTLGDQTSGSSIHRVSMQRPPSVERLRPSRDRGSLRRGSVLEAGAVDSATLDPQANYLQLVLVDAQARQAPRTTGDAPRRQRQPQPQPYPQPQQGVEVLGTTHPRRRAPVQDERRARRYAPPRSNEPRLCVIL